jgi:hypothetical protein
MTLYAQISMFFAILKEKFTLPQKLINVKVQDVRSKTLKALRIFGIVLNVNMTSVTIA